jgi:hypothetical protein
MSQASAILAPAPAAALAHGADQRIVSLVERLAEVGSAFAGLDRAVGQIGSRAEAFAGACQKHDATFVFGRCAPDRAPERLLQRNVDRVVTPGPVQRQGQNPGIKRFQQDRLI